MNFRKLIVSVIFFSFSLSSFAQGFTNPVLPGFYPDPSVCRNGDDYYMVNSSFQFFPGAPVHHSKDLIHWELVGYCFTRKSQIDLSKANNALGMYAPSIRYHDGTFYMVTTNVPNGGQIYVTATDPAGEWSDPIHVDQYGIDPDIIFDGDKTYMLSTGDGDIILSEIDIKTGKVLSPARTIWGGTGGRYPESPHIYFKDGIYYLMIAEGGTEYGHKVTIARSKNIYGAYMPCPSNPIMTHINANAASNPIQGIGHADIIQAHDGSWWVVALGFRPQSYLHHVLGRETFLAPVRWDKNAWPVINGNGTVNINMDCNTLPQVPFKEKPARDEFNSPKLDMEWNYICMPAFDNYSLSARKGFLRLKATGITLEDAGSPTAIFKHQKHMKFAASTRLDYTKLRNGSEAGLSLYMSTNYQYDLKVVNKDGKHYLTLYYYIGCIRHIEKEIPLSGKSVDLKIDGSEYVYNFSYSTDAGKNFNYLGTADVRFLSSETAGGFTGVTIGLFAQVRKDAPDRSAASFADFDWFQYNEVK